MSVATTLESAGIANSVDGGNFLLSGKVDAGNFAAAASGGVTFGSFLSLSEAHVAKEALGSVPLTIIPVDVPRDLTRAKAEELHAALSSMVKPVWIQCATANRASAVLALHMALKNSWSVGETMEWAKANGLKFVGTEALRNWVIRTIAPPTASDLSGVQPGNVILRQLFEPVTSTYTYLLADPVSLEGVLIDPVLEKADRDVQIVTELGVSIKYALNTHMHADHVTGTHALKAKLPPFKSVIAAASGAAADLPVKEGDLIPFGTRHLRVMATPGHTDGCLSFVLDDQSMAFTGDALFVRGCGRTDFQQGNAGTLYDNIHGKIFTLPEACVIYPGHDYNGHMRSTVAEEKRYNPRLNKTRDEFIAIMAGLNLPKPKYIDVALPANMRDGAPDPAAATAVATAGAEGAAAATGGAGAVPAVKA